MSIQIIFTKQLIDLYRIAHKNKTHQKVLQKSIFIQNTMDEGLTPEAEKRVNVRVESPTTNKQKSNSSKDENGSNKSKVESVNNDETSFLTLKGVVKDSASKIDYMTEIGVEQKESLNIEEKICADGLFRVSNNFCFAGSIFQY